MSNGSTEKDRFNGVVYDGQYVWFIPSWTDSLVRINNKTLELTNVNVNTYGDDAYNGGVYDGQYIWCVTHDAGDLVRVNAETLAVERFDMTSTGVDISLGDASFLGASFDGNNTIWLHPRKSKFLVAVNRTTGDIIGTYEHPMSGASTAYGYFHGATFDGRYIWFSSYTSTKLCWFDTMGLEWNSATHGLQGSTQFNLGSSFDGRFVYFTPFRSTDQLIVDTLNGEWHKKPSPLQYYTTSGVISAASLFVNGDVFYCPSVGADIFKIGLYDYEKNAVTKGNHVVVKDLQINGATDSEIMEAEVNGVVENIDITDASFNSSNESFSFLGTNRIEVPSMGIDASADGLTILIQGKVVSNNNGRIIANVLAPGSSDGFDVNATTNAGSIGIGVGAAYRTYPVSTGTDVDLSFVIDNGVSITAYIDGVLTAPSEGAGSGALNVATTANDVSIGNIYNGGAWDRPLDGQVRRIEIFEKQLSLSDIQDWNANIDIDRTASIMLFDGRDNTDQPIIYLGQIKEGAKRIRTTFTGVYIDTYLSGAWVFGVKIG